VSGTATATRLSSHSERRHADLRASAWFAGGSLLAGVAAVGLGTFAAAAVVAVALMVLTAMRPVVAVYVYLATLPFLAGIDRDRLLPFVRPNEALLVLLLLGGSGTKCDGNKRDCERGSANDETDHGTPLHSEKPRAELFPSP